MKCLRNILIIFTSLLVFVLTGCANTDLGLPENNETIVPEFPYKGEVYYVDKSNPDASDENGDGTFYFPWKTISCGLQNIKSGDALIVLGNNSRDPVVYEERIESSTIHPLVPTGTQDQH